MWTELLKRMMFPAFSIEGEEAGGDAGGESDKGADKPDGSDKPPADDGLTDGERAVLAELERDEAPANKDEGEKDEDKGGEKDKEKGEKPEIEGEDAGDKDEAGVPWKNRAKEQERKAAEKDRLIAELQEKISKTPAQPQLTREEYRKKLISGLKEQYPAMDEEALNAIVDVATAISNAQVDAALQPYRPTVRDLHVNNARSAIAEKEKKFFEKHGKEFEEVLSQIPEQVKMTPEGARHAVANAILLVKGKHADEIEADIDARVNAAVEAALKKAGKRIVENDAGDGGRGGSNLQAVTLTRQQERQRKALCYEKQQYASLLKSLQSKAKERGQPVPQVLS